MKKILSIFTIVAVFASCGGGEDPITGDGYDRSYISKYIKRKYNSFKTLPLYTDRFIETSETSLQFDENVLFDLELALDSLESWEYEFIRKRFFDRMTIKDIAIESGLSRNTISKYFSKITNKLKYHMMYHTEYQ